MSVTPEDYPSHSKRRDPEVASQVHMALLRIEFQVFITCLTVVSLFMSDIATIVLPLSYDSAVDNWNFVLFSIFTCEIMLTLTTEGYFCSFFFFLDVLSTVTILLDVNVITNSISGSNNSLQLNSIVTQSKASRAAARAVRITKIFRLARVVKIYSSAKKAQQLKNMTEVKPKPKADRVNEREDEYQEQEQEIQSQKKENGDESEFGSQASSAIKLTQNTVKQVKDEPLDLQSRQSNISKILSEDAIKKIIIIVFCIMLSIPLLDSTNYFTPNTSWDLLSSYASALLLDPTIPPSLIDTLISEQVNLYNSLTYYSYLVSIYTPFNELHSVVLLNVSNYRLSDIGLFSSSIDTAAILSLRDDLTLNSSGSVCCSIDIIITYETFNKINAGFSIATTLFICVTIAYLLSEFSKHITSLVIAPIERMLAIVRGQKLFEENAPEGQEEYETNLVQNAIVKIKSLMAVIFGVSAIELIQERLFNNRRINDVLMDPPKRVYCIYALASVAQSHRITHILGSEIFEFFNNVAHIVHRTAYNYGGHCVKNYSDGFLLVFKLPEHELAELQQGRITEHKRSFPGRGSHRTTYLNVLSDYAVFTAVETLIKLRKEPRILKYRNEQKLLVEFGNTFNVSIQFTLTAGWSFEGILGSSYKIDSTFVGTHFDNLRTINNACDSMHDFIIFTGDLYGNISNGLRKYCRHFDKVCFEGDTPTELYTVEVDLVNVSLLSRNEKDEEEKRQFPNDDDLMNFKRAQNMASMRDEANLKDYNAQDFLAEKRLNKALKKLHADELRKKYDKSFQLYLQGSWGEAQESFDELNKIVRHDELSRRIYMFMKGYNFEAPPSWPGYKQVQQFRMGTVKLK